MFLSARPGAARHDGKVKSAWRVCECTRIAENKESSLFYFVCFIISRWNLQCRLSDISDSLSALFRHPRHIVAKDLCARLCKDPTWEEIHQVRERNTLGLRRLIVPACLHTCSGFTARLVNPSADFKRESARIFHLHLHSSLHAFLPCKPAARVRRW